MWLDSFAWLDAVGCCWFIAAAAAAAIGVVVVGVDDVGVVGEEESQYSPASNRFRSCCRGDTTGTTPSSGWCVDCSRSDCSRSRPLVGRQQLCSLLFRLVRFRENVDIPGRK